MIATSAVLLAFLASIAAGHNLHVLHTPTSRDGAASACAAAGMSLAGLNAENINEAEAVLPAHSAAWISSWNNDTYGGACLQFMNGAITAAPNCNAQLLPLCFGHHHESSSSSSSCSSSSSSSSCSSSSVPSCSSSSVPSCSSSSVPSCSSSSVPSCSSSSVPSCSSESSESCSSESSSSSDSCHLIPVSCESSSSSSCSSEIDWCASSSSCGCDDSSSSSWGCSFDSDSCGSSSSSSECDPCCAGVRKLTYQAPFGPGIYLAKVTQKFTVFDTMGPNNCTNFATLANALGFNVKTNATAPTLPYSVLVGSNGLNACGALDPVNYGTYYTVSRAWALNQPIYAMENGVVYAANSIYNCYGEYVAVLLIQNLSALSFISNSCGEICIERCRGKPSSCAALCHQQMCRPAYLQRFKTGN